MIGSCGFVRALQEVITARQEAFSLDLGALTPDALKEIQRVEFEEGSKDFEEIIKTGMQ